MGPHRKRVLLRVVNAMVSKRRRASKGRKSGPPYREQGAGGRCFAEWKESGHQTEFERVFFRSCHPSAAWLDLGQQGP